MLVYYIVDLAYQLHFLFCNLQVTTNLQSSVYSPNITTCETGHVKILSDMAGLGPSTSNVTCMLI